MGQIWRRAAGQPTVVEKRLHRPTHSVQVDAGQPLQAIRHAPDGGVGNSPLGLQPPKGQASLCSNRSGPMKRRQEKQAPLDGLLAGRAHRRPCRVEGQAGQSRDALALQLRRRLLPLLSECRGQGSAVSRLLIFRLVGRPAVARWRWVQLLVISN